MQLDIGSRVRTRDGESAGKVKRIIFDADHMTVRQFVMQAGILMHSERIVDVRLIDEIGDDHTVTIHTEAEGVDDLPAYVPAINTPIIYSDLLHAHEMGVIKRPGSIPADAVVLGHGSHIYDVDGEHIGHLDEVVYGDAGQATAFVVDSGFLFDREVTIPIETIASITHGRIELKVTASEIEKERVA